MHSTYSRLQFSLLNYRKKTQTQNLRWSLKILLTTYQTRQRLQLKSFVLKDCKSLTEIYFSEKRIQILHLLEIVHNVLKKNSCALF